MEGLLVLAVREVERGQWFSLKNYYVQLRRSKMLVVPRDPARRPQLANKQQQ
jgi:hypothetical protein